MLVDIEKGASVPSSSNSRWGTPVQFSVETEPGSPRSHTSVPSTADRCLVDNKCSRNGGWVGLCEQGGASFRPGFSVPRKGHRALDLAGP